jgi:hypothetical protein
MWCSYITQKINCKKIILVATTFGILMYFHLRNQFCKNGMIYLFLCLGLEIWLHSTQIYQCQAPLNKQFPTWKHHPSNISLKENLQYFSFVVWIKSNNEMGGKLEKTSLKEACLVETIDFKMKVA